MSDQRDWILAIETSNPSAEGAGVGVALGRLNPPGADARVEKLAARGAGMTRGGLDDDLMPAIDRLLRGAQVQPRQLARVAVSAGPGGYTGLRVACSVGKLIAEGVGCKCVSVRSAHAALVSTWPGIQADIQPGLPVRVAVLLASKGGASWCEVYTVPGGAQAEPINATTEGDGRLITKEDVGPMASAGVCVLLGDQFVAPELLAAARSLGMAVHSPSFDPIAVLRLGVVGQPIDPAVLNPIYPREPDAVTLWRARQSAKGNPGSV